MAKRIRPNNGPWSGDDDQQLIAYRMNGVSYRDIARRLGRTNDACRTRYKLLNKRSFAKSISKPAEVETVKATAIIDDIEDIDMNNGVIWPKQPEVVDETGRPWSDKDLELLYEMRRASVPYTLIGAELKRSPEACSSKWNVTDWATMPFYSFENEEQQEQKKEDYRNKILTAADRRHERHKIGIDVLADRLERAVKALPNIPPPKYVRTKDVGHKEEDVMLVLSDIHIGAEHSFEETGGISEFNRPRLNSRISNLQYAVRDIVELHSKLYDLPHLHIACLGDVVAGDNSSGEWSQNYISMPIVEQVMEGVNKIKDMIAYWLTIFPEITFYGVRGNHGRTGQKGVEKDFSNYDYLCYRFLELAFRDNSRVRFIVPKTWWILTEIRGWKFLMVHGDDVRGGSFPIKKLTDFESKMMGIIKEIPNYTLAGHFHNSAELSTNHGCVILNGSFVGGDVYSIKTIHANTRPEQTIFGINESRGKTWKYNIDLDHERDPD